MKPKLLRFIAGLLRTVSYVLVFYAGLAIGTYGANAGAPPVVALVCAVLLGAAASATREVIDL